MVTLQKTHKKHAWVAFVVVAGIVAAAYLGTNLATDIRGAVTNTAQVPLSIQTCFNTCNNNYYICARQARGDRAKQLACQQAEDRCRAKCAGCQQSWRNCRLQNRPANFCETMANQCARQ